MLRKVFLIGLGIWAPFGAWALGLGDIKLNSALNEPLNAEIEITISDRNELNKFSAKVASAETFSRYGLDRPVFLNSFDFQIRPGSNNQAVLLVTSRRPLTEPFVTFLVEANWERGRLLREYTVLLDPPVFNDQAVSAPVSVAQSVTSQPTYSSGQIVQPAAPQPAPQPQPQPVYRPAAIVGQTYGPVRRNENLWNISKSALADGISVNQMMIAIYRANPEAFMGNINLLKEGATLQIPSSDSVRDLNRATANNVVVEHNSSWRGGRVNTRVASSTSGTSGSSQRLELVAPKDDPAGVGSGASGKALDEARQMLAQEEAESRRLGEEVDSVRKELEETQRLLNLRNADLADLQQRLSQQASTAATDTGVDASETPVVPVTDVEPADSQTTDVAAVDTQGTTPVTTSAPDPTTTPVDTTPQTPVKVAQAPAATEPGLLDRVMGLLSNWWTYAAVGLLSLLAVGFVMLRGRDSTETESWDAIPADDDLDVNLDASLDKVAAESAAVPAGETAEVEYFEDTGTFKPIDFDASDSSDGGLGAAAAEEGAYPFEDTLAGETGVKLDQQDALSEADFHLAYGLYDQAADLVSKAAEKEPKRIDLQTKLLEIYFVWSNKAEFRNQAEKLQTMLGTDHPGEWEKIMIMGKQICPDDELFAGEAAAPMMADSVDLQLEESGYTELDFATGDDGSPSEGFSDENVIDLDLGDALFASDDAPTAAGTDDNVLDFNIDFDGPAALGDDAPTATKENVKEKIEQALNTDSSEDTEEMDLDQLGIDLDFGDVTSVSIGTSGEFEIGEAAQAAADADEEDFDELFAGLDDPEEEIPVEALETSAADLVTVATPAGDFGTGDKLLDTSELKVEMEELLAAEVPGMADETSSTLERIDLDADSDSGSFSAEIRALSDDNTLDIGEELAATGVAGGSAIPAGSDDETVLQETLVAGANTADVVTDSEFDEIFAGADDETMLAEAMLEQDGPISADVPTSYSSDTTAMPHLQDTGDDATANHDAITFHGVFDEPQTDNVPPVDDFSSDVFGGAADGQTQEMQAIDLDIGDTVDDTTDGTTVRVATSNLALPENVDLAINEVGTKLDLARAYLDMGDPDGARGILEEVLQEGNDIQQQDAKRLLESLS